MFTHLNGEHNGLALEPSVNDGRLRLPRARLFGYCRGIRALLLVLRRGLRDMELSADWVDSLLCLLESCTANVPSSTYTGESPDISLYDHLKMTAAISACIANTCWKQARRIIRPDCLTTRPTFAWSRRS